MRFIKKMLLKIYKYFNDMSLLRKLTMAYTIAILIPTIVIGFYTYYQSMNSIKQETAQNAERNLIHIKEDIERKSVLIKNVTDNIVYNKKIQNLLNYGMEFTPEAINYFIESIANPIDYALDFNDANIYQIGVYFVNKTVPEYNNFYKEERIKDEEWYDSFIKSKQDEIWIYPAKSNRFNLNTNITKANKTDINITDKQEDLTVLKMVKKIKGVNGKYLGVVTIDILEEDIFSSMNTGLKNNEIYAMNIEKNIVYPHRYDDAQKYIMLQIIDTGKKQGYSVHGNVLYSYETIEPLNIKIISKTPIESLVKKTFLASGYNILAVVLGVIVLEIFTYFILKMIFSRLNQIVMVMSIVAKGNFNIRIPIAHNDEVGQMAESFNVLIEKINFLISDVVKKETAYKDVQLTALQYQINPHFIYNTIDIFRMKLELEGNYEMADAITSFGKLLRYNINRDSQYATIKEEVDYIEKYFNLQKIRYGEKIVLIADLPKDFNNIKIIRFMLQPIIENSIKHGITNYKNELCIQIRFFKKMGCVQVHVIDNGRGITVAELEMLNKQLKNSRALEKKNDTYKNIGLENINSRIKLFYGEQYYIKLESIEGEYTKAIINIPYVQD